ncbi:MAG: hypothetical protein K6E97_12255 [Treponema sp.]|nr:hypothetical protein [Treponema sp.]
MKKLIIALLTLVLFASCGSNADDSNVKVGDVYYSDGTTAHVDSRNKSKDNQVAGFVVSIKNGKPAVIMCRKLVEKSDIDWRYYMTNKTRKDCFPSQHVFDSNGTELSKTDVSGKDSYSQYLSQEDSVKNTCVYYRWIDSLSDPEDANYIALPDGAKWYIPTMFELKAAKDKKGNYPYLKFFEDFQKGKNDSEINELCGEKISLERQDKNYYEVVYAFQSSTLRLSPSGNDQEGNQSLELLAYIDAFYPIYDHLYNHEWTGDFMVTSNFDYILWVAFAEVN